MRFFPFFILLLFSHLYGVSDVGQLISEASAHNTFFLYEDAVKFLEEAIRRDPFEKEAYKERAFSYFELNCMDLALEDYKQATNPSPPYKLAIRNSSLMIRSSPFGKVAPPTNILKKSGGIKLLLYLRLTKIISHY